MLPVLFLCFQLAQTMPPPGLRPAPGMPPEEAPSLAFSALFVDGNSALELTWSNTGQAGLFVLLGNIAGRHPLMNLRFSRAGGGQVVNRSEPAAIGARVQPFVLFLPSGGRFVHRLPIRAFYDVAAGRFLGDVPGSQTTVRVDFRSRPNSTPDFLGISVWTGRLSAKASLVRPGGTRK